MSWTVNGSVWQKIPCQYYKNPVSYWTKNNDYSGYYFCCLEHEESIFMKTVLEKMVRTYKNGRVVGFIYKITHKQTGKCILVKKITLSFVGFNILKRRQVLFPWSNEEQQNNWVDLWGYRRFRRRFRKRLELKSKYIAEYNATGSWIGYNTKDWKQNFRGLGRSGLGTLESFYYITRTIKNNDENTKNNKKQLTRIKESV